MTPRPGGAAAAERERIANWLGELAGNYPEDVFPADAESRDAISGAAMRHAYRTAARLVREDMPVRRPGAGTVRLTFPSYDMGAADILADGRRVGIALAEFWNWRAFLYPVTQEGRVRVHRDCEEVTAKTLADLRKALRARVAADGPWWQQAAPAERPAS